MEKKFYLVTGGTGFIGSALVRRLVKDGHRVRVFDNNIRGAISRLDEIKSDIEIVTADIRDMDAVITAGKGVDSIIHLAFINGTRFFYEKPELVLDIGVRGMLSVLDSCKKNGIRELILASSSEVYQTPPVVPTDETAPLSIPDPLNPRYSYGGGKLICELMAINYGRTNFDRVIIFRPHNIYGPDMGWEHVISEFVIRMKKLCERYSDDPLEFQIQGTGNETRAFCYIDDFIDGLMILLEKGDHLNIYHIGTEEERTILEVAQTISEYFKRAIKIKPGEKAKGGTTRRCPDTGKLQKLGYKPTWNFRDGVFKLAEWYVNQSERVKP